MVRKKISLIILLCLFSCLFSQITRVQIDSKIKKASDYNALEKRDEAFKLLLEANNDSKKINYKSGLLASNEGLISMYTYKNAWEKVIEVANETEKFAVLPDDVGRLGMAYTGKGIAYTYLGFLDQALVDFKKSISYNEMSEDKNLTHHQNSVVYQSMVVYYEIKNKPDSTIFFLKKSIEESKKIDDKSKYAKYKYSNIIFTNLNIASYYTGVSKPKRLDLAEQYFNDILKYKNTKDFQVSSIVFYNNFARLYNEKGDYKKAIELAMMALSKEIKAEDILQKKITYQTLYKAYDKLGDKDLKIKYLELYTKTSDSLRSLERSSINYSNKQIIEEKQQNFKKDQKKIWIIMAFSVVFILFILGLLWTRHIKKTHTRYETIINSFKENINAEIPEIHEESNDQEILKDTDMNKSTDISETTVQTILLYLDQFEKTNEFTNNDVSLSYLANYANTNTKYLNEILKNYKLKSFSKYINSLRINYIMKLLYQEPKYRGYKITYLAELCGFSSRQVFTSVFKKETGITTSYYINQLKNESYIPSNILD